MTRFFSLFSIIFVLFALPAQAASAPVTELNIVSGSTTHRFSVEVAITPKQQEKGLMFRTEMAADHGMLFVMREEVPMQMWMKNTALSLDMLFIDRYGEIRYIAHSTTPYSTDLIRYEEPVRAVLELLGGTSQSLNIQVGDRVMHPSFTP
ncbi:MAG: DUF192 domain-containing protein [Proteobacteria bacterium]|nr:DUF192 domain-containing protein [Pseudomonadota bacterium]